MGQLYSDYLWKGGIPYGIGERSSSTGYKIVMDPYRKRICIEHYGPDEAIPKLIYDSALLDFRHVKQADQTAWQKTVIRETKQEVVCLIRDQNDRLLCVETHIFQNDLSRECRINSPHGIYLSSHKMFYTCLQDAFDGVILYDSYQHPVMVKRYLFDFSSKQFTDLLEENWEVPLKGL